MKHNKLSVFENRKQKKPEIKHQVPKYLKKDLKKKILKYGTRIAKYHGEKQERPEALCLLSGGCCEVGQCMWRMFGLHAVKYEACWAWESRQSGERRLVFLFAFQYLKIKGSVSMQQKKHLVIRFGSYLKSPTTLRGKI